MAIRFGRSGGLAGLRGKPLVIDTSELAAGECAAWEERVARSRFFDLPTRNPQVGPARDAFVYSITVDDGGRRHTVATGERDAGPLAALVKALKSYRSRERRLPAVRPIRTYEAESPGGAAAHDRRAASSAPTAKTTTAPYWWA